MLPLRSRRAASPVRLRILRGLGTLAIAVGPLGCVFTVPPPLPEELAEIEASERARSAAVQGGEPFDPDAAPAEGGEASGALDPSQFAKGDPAPEGMSTAQMQAFATAQGDPKQGRFTLDEALAGMTGQGTLTAVFHTNAGTMSCELYERQAPTTVANFVGLARGLRPTMDPKDPEGPWITGPFYDGVIFHRVIPGFMIQGGDPTGTGRGQVGYVIEDEFVDSLVHDRAGILSMANHGPGTGAAQFFITLAPTPHLDGLHTIFGACDDAAIDVAEHIAAKRGPNDRPTDPQIIERLEITRR